MFISADICVQICACEYASVHTHTHVHVGVCKHQSQAHTENNTLKEKKGTFRAATQSEIDGNKDDYKHFVLHVCCVKYLKADNVQIVYLCIFYGTTLRLL